MKKFTALGILIAFIGMVGPKIIGSTVNQKLDEIVASINQAPGYHASIISHESSWFSSAATVNIGLDTSIFGDTPANSETVEFLKDASFNVNVTSQHGPFLSLNGLGLGLLAVKIEADKTVFRDQLTYSEDERFYSAALNVSLLGSGTYVDKVPEFTLSEKETSSFSSWNGEGSMSANYFDYSGHMDAVEVRGDDAILEIKSVSLAYEIEDSWSSMITSLFYNSTIDFTIGSITFDALIGESRNLRLKNLVIDGISEKSDDGQLMNMEINYGIEELTAPGFSGNNLLLKTQFKNLEKDFFTAIQDASANPLEAEQLTKAFKDNLLLQLKASPEFNINEISGAVGEGHFSGKLLMKIAGVDEMPANIENPSFWMSKAFVDSKLEIEKTMALRVAELMLISQFNSTPEISNEMTNSEIESLAAQQARTMIDTLSAQGMIIINTEGNLELSFNMNGGRAQLNGNPLPLPF